jgi:signal peptidase II
MVAMLFTVGAVFLLDLLAKRQVEARSEAGVIRLGGIVDIHHVASRKRIYSNAGFRAMLLGIWMAALASATVLLMTGSVESSIGQIALGAALGGAAGNLFDIIRSHSVRDYIDLGWWPVFNLADVAILVGLTLALLQR